LPSLLLSNTFDTTLTRERGGFPHTARQSLAFAKAVPRFVRDPLALTM